MLNMSEFTELITLKFAALHSSRHNHMSETQLSDDIIIYGEHNKSDIAALTAVVKTYSDL